jgi:hypothetical protein
VSDTADNNDQNKAGNTNGSDNANNANNPDNADNLSDQDIAKALKGFEEDFKDLEGFGADGPQGLKDSSAGVGENSGVGETGESVPPDDLSAFDDPLEAELEGILGDKAKAAMLITPLQQPELLSAFCVLADVSAYCIGAEQGAVAVLKNLAGSSPEAAAKDLTTVISGLSVVLAVNRADKLEAKLWMNGEQGSDFAPPILFMNVAEFVEDFMIGSTDLDGLKANGLTVVDSGAMSRGEALKVIAAHTKFRPGADGGTGIVE